MLGKFVSRSVLQRFTITKGLLSAIPIRTHYIVFVFSAGTRGELRVFSFPYIEEGGSDNRKSRERVCFRRLDASLQWYIHQSDQIWIITGVYWPRRAEKYEKLPICVFYHCYFVFRYTSRSGRVRKSFWWNKILNSLIFS